jgi:hypothetical protein
MLWYVLLFAVGVFVGFCIRHCQMSWSDEVILGVVKDLSLDCSICIEVGPGRLCISKSDDWPDMDADDDDDSEDEATMPPDPSDRLQFSNN